MPGIDLSLFELFKIGPGPSSSHTIGPMAAGLDFRRRLEALPREDKDRAVSLEVVLLGSLSATGPGHGTDRAVTAGLLGWAPESIDPVRFAALLTPDSPEALFQASGLSLPLTGENIVFGPVVHDHPFANTLVITLHGPDGPLLEQVYYSVGGGFIQWPDYRPPERGTLPYPFTTMDRLQLSLTKYDLDLSRLMLRNEAALTGADESTILAGLDRLIDIMVDSVERGLSRDGVLPAQNRFATQGGLSQRPGRAEPGPTPPGAAQDQRPAALAASEENAAGGIVVTAPTLGSAGVLPSLIYRLISKKLADRDALRRGLLAAGGDRISDQTQRQHRRSRGRLPGRGRSRLGHGRGHARLHPRQGQPGGNGQRGRDRPGAPSRPDLRPGVGGYVQIPCIERNAMGAVKAYNSYLLASAGDPCRQKVGFDQAVAAMLSTGRDMSTKYKETSLGGLAVSLAEC